MLVDQFADQLEPHHDAALRYCRALCADWSPSEAEDVLQQALLRALRKRRQLRDPTKFKAWLFQIITRTFYSATRRSFWTRFVPLSAQPDVEQIPSVYHRPERYDDQHVLHAALATLPARQRAAVLLYELGGFSIDDIAAIQGDKSRSAVKSRLSRARNQLKRYILGAERSAPGTSRPPGGPKLGDLEDETLKMVAQTAQGGE